MSANKQEVFFYTTSLQGACSDILKILHRQHAKKVVYDSLGLVYFAFRASEFCSYPTSKSIILGEFKLQQNYNQSCLSIFFFRLAELTFGLVHTSCKAVKVTF